jgi:hypothetical protein
VKWATVSGSRNVYNVNIEEAEMNQNEDHPTQGAAVRRKIRNLVDDSDKEKREVADELVQALGSSKGVLIRATTVFPLTLFPDTIAVDRSKVTITRRNFFWSGEVASLAIEDIFNVSASVGPFFGKLTITTRFSGSDQPSDELFEVNHFWREDALRLKRIIQGYLIALKKKVDTSVLSDKELTDSLDELGKASPVEKVNIV